DSGPGIPEDVRTRLFERFSQADEGVARRHGGSGLGLAICRELAELMGGRIAVESEPGHGSTFRVELPFAEVAADSGTTGAGPETATETTTAISPEPPDEGAIAAQTESTGTATQSAGMPAGRSEER